MKDNNPLHGKSLSELTQEDFAEFTHPEEAQAAYADIQNNETHFHDIPKRSIEADVLTVITNITRYKMRAIAARNELRTVETKMSEIVLNLQIAIVTESDDATGKLKYTNESMRNAQLSLRLGDNVEYAKLALESEQLKTIELENNLWAMECEKLERYFRIDYESSKLGRRD